MKNTKTRNYKLRRPIVNDILKRKRTHNQYLTAVSTTKLNKKRPSRVTRTYSTL